LGFLVDVRAIDAWCEEVGMTTSEMNAIVRDETSVRFTRAKVPSVRAGWVRVRVLLAGICRTDLYAADGLFTIDAPRILGHEMVGEIEARGSGSAFAIGERVTVSPLVRCEACASCLRGDGCASPKMIGVGLDGAFAESIVVPDACVHIVGRDLPLRRAAYVEPICASLAVIRAPIHPSQRGALLGTGRIASLTSRVMKARNFGSIDVLDENAIEESTYDFVIETSATEDILAQAIRSVKPGGVVVLKSRPAHRVAIDITRAVLKDVTFAAVGYGDFDEAVRLAGELAIDDLLGDIFPLDRFDAAFARARTERGGSKIFLSPSGEG
jgi:threonine dehydrogenase-like Zn-dependent dehydrogenase